MRTGQRSIAALAVFLFLTAPVPAFGQGKFVIDDDDGGSIEVFRMWYKRVADSGVPVVLRGICASACTFVLSLPKSQVCVEPTASLGFHTWTTFGNPDPDYTAAGARRLYPLVVQEWVSEHRIVPWPITYMTAGEIVKLGIFPACE